jgi:DNA-binding transcriptional regulator YiaG
MTAQQELLARAVEAEGSKQAVATALHVPERTFDRWLEGRAQMPDKATKLLIEIIAKRHQAPK